MNEQKDRQGIAVSESISAATSTVSFSSMIDVETERLTDPQRALLIEMVKRLSDGSTAIRYISKRGDAGSVDYEHCLIAVDSPDGVTQFLLTARNGEGKFMPSIFNLRFFNLISGSNGVVFYYNNVTWENFSGVTIQGPSDPSQAEAWRIAGKKYWEETGGFFDANHFNYIYYGQKYQNIGPHKELTDADILDLAEQIRNGKVNKQRTELRFSHFAHIAERLSQLVQISTHHEELIVEGPNSGLQRQV